MSDFTAERRAELLLVAAAAESASRYDDLYTALKTLLEGRSDGLTVEERRLLAVAYEQVVGSRRAAWRALRLAPNTGAVRAYRDVLQVELETLGTDAIALLHEAAAVYQGTDDEGQVLGNKVIGDIYQALAELVPDRGYDRVAAEHYERGYLAATRKLAPTHPLRLGLILNYATCEYEILKQHKKACELAKKAFDEAISKLDQLDERSYAVSTHLMQLLRDHLTLWTADDAA